MNVSFAQPSWLLLSLLLPALYWVFVRIETRNSELRGYFSGQVALPSAHARWVWLAIALLSILLLAQPMRDSTSAPPHAKPLEVIFLIDESNSMFAQDRAPSRLESAKQQLATFIQDAPFAQVAIAHFAGETRILAPLTSDRVFLLDALNRIGTRPFQHGGSQLHSAIVETLSILGDDTQRPILVVLTDGDNQQTGIEPALSAIEQGNVATVIIGLGDDQTGARIPVGDQWLTHNGQEVWSQLNHNNARQLAERSTWVTYLPIGTHLFSLTDVLQQLSRANAERPQNQAMQSKTTQSQSTQNQAEPFTMPLVLVLIALLLSRVWRRPLFFCLPLCGYWALQSPHCFAEPSPSIKQASSIEKTLSVEETLSVEKTPYLEQVEQYQQALERAQNCNHAIALRYNLATAYIHLAVDADQQALSEQGDFNAPDSQSHFAAAKHHLNVVLRHQPQHRDAQQNLAWIGFYENLQAQQDAAPQSEPNQQPRDAADDKPQSEPPQSETLSAKKADGKNRVQQPKLEQQAKEIELQKSENAQAIVQSLMKAKPSEVSPDDLLKKTW